MFQTILVGLKFNQAGHRALETAAHMAHRMGATLSAVHALDYHLEGNDLRDACDEAHRAFKTLSADIKCFDTPITLICEPGEPSMVVCRTARNLGAGLIVLGCHQEGECLSRMDYTGMTVVEKATCPVMIVPLVTQTITNGVPAEEEPMTMVGVPAPEGIP